MTSEAVMDPELERMMRLAAEFRAECEAMTARFESRIADLRARRVAAKAAKPEPLNEWELEAIRMIAVMERAPNVIRLLDEHAALKGNASLWHVPQG